MKRHLPDAPVFRSGYDRNDCAVHAASQVLNIPYDDAWKLAALSGREQFKGTWSSQFMEYLTTHTGYKMVEIPCYDLQIRLAEFVEVYPVGRFYVCKRGHAFAVVNGTVIDTTTQFREPGCKIWQAWYLEGSFIPSKMLTNEVLEEF